jgi:iron only hydrogenase large subunit-like protein
LDGNFIEGMACIGGCIGGAGCLTHGDVNKIHVDKHSKKATFTEITAAVDAIQK